jgi:carboxyl-terminal processing protease
MLNVKRPANSELTWKTVSRLLALLLWCAAARNAGAAEQCARVSEFDEIAAVVTKEFYDRSFRGLPWSSRVEHYRGLVDCGQDERHLASVVNRLLAELRASHTGLYTKDDFEYWAFQSIFSRGTEKYPVDFSGIWPEQRDGAWYAKYVIPGTPAAAAGIHAGDLLVSLDGQPFRTFGFSAQRPSTLTVSSDGRARRDVQIQAVTGSMQRFLLEASRNSTSIMDIDGRSVGYFHLWAGTHTMFLQSLHVALESFEHARVAAVIVDLRGGFGGAGLEYLAKIRSSVWLKDLPKYFLIDDGSRSGKEWVAATVKAERIGTLVGSRTAGAFLGGSQFRFADERYVLLLAVSAFTPPGIGPIEGIGVEPDVLVTPCRAYCGGRDPQLEKVFELIRQRG